MKQDVTFNFKGLELQCDDPLELGELWAKVAGLISNIAATILPWNSTMPQSDLSKLLTVEVPD